MTEGTAGFNGASLRLARELRGMTIAELADMIKRTRQAVSQYETGVTTPRAEIVSRLGFVLDFPVTFFLQPDTPPTPHTVFYRSLRRATEESRRRGTARSSLLIEIVKYIEMSVRFPSVDLPEVTLPNDPTAISADDIEDAAQLTRKHWGLGNGPIGNLVRLLEQKGVVVSRDDLGTDGIDAFSYIDPSTGRPYITLGADKRSAARSRLNAAHELAHLILHRNVNESTMRQPGMLDELESQAFQFAGAFLLPAETFVGEIGRIDLNTLARLKLRWKVAVQAMIMRLFNLGIINDVDRKRLFMGIARRKWKTVEPFDHEIEREEPKLLASAIDLMCREEIESPGMLAHVIDIRVDDVASISGIPINLLRSHDSEPIQLSVHRRLA